MAIQSGPFPLSRMAQASSFQNSGAETADLIPTGSPVAEAMDSMKTRSEGMSEKAVCASGLRQSIPGATPRRKAISSVTFAAGSRPPLPGSEPWESLSSTPRTCR